MSLPSGYNRWCRRYRPAEHATVRLGCFPHAGGSAPFYLPMAAALSPGVLKVFPGGHFFLADRADEVMKVLDRHFRFERDRIVA